MIREIKFRVWDTTRKIMLYPEDLTHDWYFRCDTFQVHQVKEKFGRLCINEIKDPVIMQYTGLKDKNGKEVYDGDIVDRRGEHVVVDLAIPTLEDAKGGNFDNFIHWCLYSESHSGLGGMGREEIEAIGNIYENPELVDNGVLE